ncbi:MAG: hypothetical protein RRZ70_04520 [Synergistaceae bacterium]
MNNNLHEEWNKKCIRIGAPTNLLAAATAFLPVLWLCSTYNCWPKLSVVLEAWALVAASFGAFYFVEPLSYYSVLGLSGTYLSFLSGNIGNMRVPCAAIALEATNTESGTLQAEIVGTLGICGSIVTNLFFVLLAAIVGAQIVAILPPVIASAFVKYSAAAIFGGTFGNFAVKYPKVAVFALGIPLLIASFFKVPAYILIPLSVFGSIAVGRFFYVQEHKA